MLLCLIVAGGCIHKSKTLIVPPEDLIISTETERPEEISSPRESKTLQPEPKDKVIYQLPEFEELTYDVRWIGLKAGTITATIEGIKEYEGRDVYVFRLHVTSQGWVSAIYKIDSTYLSYVEVKHMHTLYEEVNRKEGSYRKHAIVKYDQMNHKAHYKSYTDGTEKTFDIPPDAIDGLGAVYYFRTLSFTLDETIAFPVVLDEKVYEFYADILSREMIRAGHYGKREAVKVRPYGFLKGETVREGTMIGYFDPGQVKVPLYSKVKTPLFTSATATLRDMNYPNNDVSPKKGKK